MPTIMRRSFLLATLLAPVLGLSQTGTNSSCSTAIVLPVAPSNLQLALLPVDGRWFANAVPDPITACSGNAQATTAWFSFTATATKHWIRTDGQGTDDARMEVFSGGCGNLSSIGCFPANGAMPALTGLTVGANYHFRVQMSNQGFCQSNPDYCQVWIGVVSAPVNDECAGAIALTVVPPTAVAWPSTEISSLGATRSQVACTVGADDDVWYRFTATENKHMLGTTSLSDVVQTNVYEWFSGTCGNLTSLACNASVATGLTPGTQYYIRAHELPFSSVQDYSNTPRGSNAIAADGTGGCLPTKDVWYRFTAEHTSAGFMAVNGDQGFLDTSIELFQGTCGSLTSLGCTNDEPRAIFNGLVPGTEYHIRWSRASIGLHTPMLFDQPVNDDVAGALPAPWGSTFAQAAEQYDTFGATESMPTHCPGWAPDDDMWFTFTASATTHSVQAQQGNNSFYEPSLFPYSAFQVQVYDTLTSDPTVLAANLVGCGFSPVALTGLTIGKQYLYRVFQAEAGPTRRCGFSTSVSNTNNDEAAGAHTLVYADDYTAYFNTTGATQSLPGADCQVDDTADDDIWFKFTAAAGAARIAIGYATADVTIELFSGTPSNLLSIACDGNILELSALTSGQTYYARVYSWGNAVPVEGRIGLFLTPSLTANGCVDENCLGPVLLNNPGIEQGEQCFAHVADVGAIAGQGGLLAPGWPRMQGGSSDAFGSCSLYGERREVPGPIGNYQNAPMLLSRSGKGMGGLLMANGQPFAYVEYLQAQLAEPLVPGEPYLVSFYAAIDPTYNICLSGLGAALSEGPLVWGYQNGPLTAQPAAVSLDAICTMEWTNVCAIYVPTSPVDHITIGAFQRTGEPRRIGPSTGDSYYAIDDVVVSRINDPSCITSIGDVPPLDESAGEGDALRVYPNPANELLNIVADPSLFGNACSDRSVRRHGQPCSC
jgi:hypothetical protein